MKKYTLLVLLIFVLCSCAESPNELVTKQINPEISSQINAKDVPGINDALLNSGSRLAADLDIEQMIALTFEEYPSRYLLVEANSTSEGGLATIYDANDGVFNQFYVENNETSAGSSFAFQTVTGEVFIILNLIGDRVVGYEIPTQGSGNGRADCLGQTSTAACIEVASDSCSSDAGCLLTCTRYLRWQCAAAVAIACAVSCNN